MSLLPLDPDSCYRALASRDARFDGRFFIAVRSTGIYCRPICPAPTAKRENVSFFATAAAAQEGGYRPCLRCRPEAAPDSGAWRGVANSGHSHAVTRALELIELGALDSAGVADLAERLGLGERQLRRLFADHVGASPLSVAQTRRVLLAQQLLRETALPLTEIAFAAGFGSIRRFNEVFQALFQRPPSALRHGPGARTAAPRAGEVSLLLRYRPPYDWPAMLGFLRARAIPGLEQVDDAIEGGRYVRVLEIAGQQGRVCVSHAPAQQALRVQLRASQLSLLPQVIARLRRMFDLGADPETIASQLGERDALMARLLQERPGLRVPGCWDGFELAIRAVLGQQITVGAAIQLSGKLLQQHGVATHSPDLEFPGLSHLFPSPAALAAVDLSPLGMPRSRAATLSAVAQACRATPALLERQTSLEQALASWRALPGIGDWTAQYIAIRQLREPDAFPAADVGLMQAIEKLEGSRPCARQLAERAQAWRPWRAYAAQHLWTAIAAPLPSASPSAAPPQGVGRNETLPLPATH